MHTTKFLNLISFYISSSTSKISRNYDLSFENFLNQLLLLHIIHCVGFY